MDPSHYENDFESTSIEELEFVRSPFYDLAKYEHTQEGEKARDLLDSLHLKHQIISPINSVIQPEKKNKTNVAYTRYADN